MDTAVNLRKLRYLSPQSFGNIITDWHQMQKYDEEKRNICTNFNTGGTAVFHEVFTTILHEMSSGY